MRYYRSASCASRSSRLRWAISFASSEAWLPELITGISPSLSLNWDSQRARALTPIPRFFAHCCNSCEGKVFHAPEGKVCPIYDCVINNKCMPTLVPCWQLGTLGLVAQNLDEYMKPTNTWMTMVWISVKICFPGQTSCRQNAESNLNDMPLFAAVAYVGVPTMERLQCI